MDINKVLEEAVNIEYQCHYKECNRTPAYKEYRGTGAWCRPFSIKWQEGILAEEIYSCITQPFPV